MKLAVVGSGRLADSKFVERHIYKSLMRFQPTVVILLPGHDRFNALVREQARRLSLPVEQMQPPRPFLMGKCLQSVRKRWVRGIYAKAIAQEADLVLAYKAGGAPGVTFSQLLETAKEPFVVTVNVLA